MMDKVYIKHIVQNILDQEFNVIQKRRINEYHDRLNIACPYCQDSSKNVSAKRGNLYLNKLIYICFNCGIKSNFDRMAKRFRQQLDPDKKMEIIEHLNAQITYSDVENDLIETEFDKLINLEDIERIFNSGEHIITDFKPIIKDSPVYSYLLSRGILPEYHKHIYQAKYWINSDRYDPVMCLLNRRGGKVLTVQVRNLKEGKRRVFKIYNFESLYKWINNIEGDIEDMDVNEIVAYNKIGAYFNILNVNFDQKVTVFEGYLDSLFYPNSIGVVGVNTDFDFLESNNLELQYFFDNDEAGFKTSEEKIKQGYPVFLWKKLFETIVERKGDTDPYGLMYRISKVKDLNKLAELVPSPYKKLELDKMFSKDLYDLKWIPKKEKKKWISYTKSRQ
jgi:hypothetical protein